jgi:hypothetical protein
LAKIEVLALNPPLLIPRFQWRNTSLISTLHVSSELLLPELEADGDSEQIDGDCEAIER